MASWKARGVSDKVPSFHRQNKHAIDAGECGLKRASTQLRAVQRFPRNDGYCC
jgi:hypothetical protein